MTEAEWLTSSSIRTMLEFAAVSPQCRKYQLVVCGCARLVWAWFAPTERKALRRIEDWAENPADHARRKDLYNGANGRMRERRRQPDCSKIEWHALAAISSAVWSGFPPNCYSVEQILALAQGITQETALRMEANVIRDIFGNPFRPVAFSPSWRTDTAVALARQMYESREFSAMPILADALQDAGCDNPDILSHCRDEKAGGGSGEPAGGFSAQGGHVRGCWVVDLVLGKE